MRGVLSSSLYCYAVKDKSDKSEMVRAVCPSSALESGRIRSINSPQMNSCLLRWTQTHITDKGVISLNLFLSMTWQMMSGARRKRLLMAKALSVWTSI